MTPLDRAAGLNWRFISRRRYIVVVSDAAAYPNREQWAPSSQAFAPVPRQTMLSVWVLDPRMHTRRFMRVLIAAGNASFIDAAHGETVLARLKNRWGESERCRGSERASTARTQRGEGSTA